MYEVRYFALDLIAFAAGLQTERVLIDTKVMRWRWRARLSCWICNHTPPLLPILMSAEWRPRLSVVPQQGVERTT